MFAMRMVIPYALMCYHIKLIIFVQSVKLNIYIKSVFLINYLINTV